MKFFPILFLLIPTLAAAEPAVRHDDDFLPGRYKQASTTPVTDSMHNNLASPTAAPTSPRTLSPFEYEDLPIALKQFIIDMTPKSKIGNRQGAAQGGGAAGAAATPTQLSPTTVYDIGAGPTTYVQTFAPTPDQWPQPAAGTIGLGTIAGTVGKVRTYNNPAPTIAPERLMGFVMAGGVGAVMVL